MTTPRVLFILKKPDPTVFTSGSYVSAPGLQLSAKMTAQMLSSSLGCVTSVVQVIDNNSIDREVTNFKPTHVIIDALWVVPDKFTILQQLHPTVQWLILIHSKIPFLSSESVSMNWIPKYLHWMNVSVGFNSDDTAASFAQLTGNNKKIFFLPNYYPEQFTNSWTDVSGSVINVGCFGAIRPLKNQLIQATAAIQYAEQNFLKLNYHINSSRIEQSGNSTLQNIRALFASSSATLVEHPWTDHDTFVKLMQQMQISLQVSFSETYNIVTADAVANGIPVVVSSDIAWVNGLFTASPTSTASIIQKMGRALWYRRYLQWVFDVNQLGLKQENALAVSQWKKYLKV